jgi:hypothetical protein
MGLAYRTSFRHGINYVTPPTRVGLRIVTLKRAKYKPEQTKALAKRAFRRIFLQYKHLFWVSLIHVMHPLAHQTSR